MFKSIIQWIECRGEANHYFCCLLFSVFLGVVLFLLFLFLDIFFPGLSKIQFGLILAGGALVLMGLLLRLVFQMFECRERRIRMLLGDESSFLDSNCVISKKELLESERKYRGIFENIAIPILILEKNWVIAMANSEFSNFTGFSKAEIEKKKSILDFTIEEEVLAVKEVLGSMVSLKRNQDIFLQNQEIHFLMKDGKVRKVMVNLTYLHQTAQSILSLMDVTELKKSRKILKFMIDELADISIYLEKKVQESVDEIRKKDNLLHQRSRLAVMGEMIENIAHQWRQPLNSLALTIQTLKMIPQQGELHYQAINEIMEESLKLIDHMAMTIDDFKKFFQPNKEKIEFSITEAVNKTIDLIHINLKKLNIKIEVEERQKNIKLLGYPNEFCHVLLNLIGNSRDILQTKGVSPALIRVCIAEEAGHPVITVWDNGGGIEEKILAHLFEPYLSNKENGTGIGLYMSKIMVEKNMGGSLSAENIDGGALFKIKY